MLSMVCYAMEERLSSLRATQPTLIQVREHNVLVEWVGFRDLYVLEGGWGAQGFPTPEVDFPSLEFLKCM